MSQVYGPGALVYTEAVIKQNLFITEQCEILIIATETLISNSQHHKQRGHRARVARRPPVSDRSIARAHSGVVTSAATR